MLILGIESSCDETAAAVVRDGEQLLSNVISSQIATHMPYGGVVPELASRLRRDQRARNSSSLIRARLHVVAAPAPPDQRGAARV